MVTSRVSALWVGFVLGVSLGPGRAIYFAYGVAQSGAYDALPGTPLRLSEREDHDLFRHGVFTLSW